MPQRVGRIVAVFSLSLLAVVLASQRDALALKISGRVVDAEGNPVRKAQVTLQPATDGKPDPAAGVRLSIRTNRKGKFIFGFAKGGEYLLSVEAGDLQLQEITVRMRDKDNHPPLLPDGTVIEDRTSPVDPAHPVVDLRIPRGIVYSVILDMKVGPPRRPEPAGGIVLAEDAREARAILAEVEAGNYARALEKLEELLPREQENAALWYVKGFALVKSGRAAEAEAPLRKAITLDPDLEGAWGLLGEVLAKEGRYDEAVEALRREIGRTEDPRQKALFELALGQALLELDRPAEAIPPLEEAHGVLPDNPQVALQLADAYIRTGAEQKADALISAGIPAHDAAVLHYNLAANLLRKKQYTDAIPHLEKAFELDPKMVQALSYEAQAWLSLGDRAKAIETYEKYLAAAPDAPDAADVKKIINALRQAPESKE